MGVFWKEKGILVTVVLKTQCGKKICSGRWKLKSEIDAKIVDDIIRRSLKFCVMSSILLQNLWSEI